MRQPFLAFIYAPAISLAQCSVCGVSYGRERAFRRRLSRFFFFFSSSRTQSRDIISPAFFPISSLCPARGETQLFKNSAFDALTKAASITLRANSLV